MNRVDNRTRLCQTHTLTHTVGAAHPAGVYHPHRRIVLFTLLSEHFRILVRMQWQEGLTEAGRERRYGLSNSHFCSSDFAGVPRDKVVHSLFRIKSGNRWDDTRSIASQKDNILGVASNGWQLDVSDVFKWVAYPGVCRQTCVIVINGAAQVSILKISCVLYNSSKFYGIKDIWLALASKSITLRVASSLNIKYVVVSPNVLVVSNQLALWVA